jgi:hypothetical protein
MRFVIWRIVAVLAFGLFVFGLYWLIIRVVGAAIGN